MPNSDKKLVNALVEAFNVNNCTHGIVDTNFITDGRHITMIFGDGMKETECRKYLGSLRDAIEDTFHRSRPEKDQGPFYLNSFPFNAQSGKIFKDKKTGKFKYEVSIDDRVLFNLQAHLIYSMTKSTIATVYSYPHSLKNEQYIMCSRFASEEIAKDFKQRFCAEMLRELKCDLSPFVEVKVEVKGNNTCNHVYISKNIVNNLDFIQRCVLYNAETIGCALEIPGIDNNSDRISKRECVLQELLTQFIRHTTDIVIDRYYHTFSKKSRERCLLLPVIAVKDEKGKKFFRYLSASEAQAINAAFGYPVVSNLAEDISDESIISAADKRNFGINGINFSNREVSQHVCTGVFGNAAAVQVNEDEYGLEVQSSPHIDKLRIKVDELRAQEAQRQEALLRAQEAQLQEAQSRAEAAQSYARAAQSAADTAQTCADTTISRTESIQKRAEAVQKRAGSAEWSAKEARFRVNAVKLRAEAAEWHEKAAQLRQEIEDKEKKQEKVREDACRPWDQFSCGSIDSNSSDETDRNRVSHDPDPAAKPPIATRSNAAAPSGSNTFGNKKGQGQSDSGQGRIPTPPPLPVDEPDQPAATVQDKDHLQLGLRNSNSSSGCSSNPGDIELETAKHKQLNVNLPSDTQDSGYDSRNSTLPRGSTPPRSGTSSAADKYKQKKSLLSRIFSFLGRKDRPEEDPYQHSISDASASSIVSKDSAISLRSQNNTVMTQGKDSVQSKLSNLQVERGNVGEKEVDVVF